MPVFCEKEVLNEVSPEKNTSLFFFHEGGRRKQLQGDSYRGYWQSTVFFFTFLSLGLLKEISVTLLNETQNFGEDIPHTCQHFFPLGWRDTTLLLLQTSFQIFCVQKSFPPCPFSSLSLAPQQWLQFRALQLCQISLPWLLKKSLLDVGSQPKNCSAQHQPFW